MIKVENVTKKFGDFAALSNLSCDIQDSGVFGLVGSNGAGKSTLVRLIAGVYKADEGSIKLDGEEIYGNFDAKSKIAYVSDELFFLPGANISRMAQMYETLRDDFDKKKLFEYAGMLGLNVKSPISQFSKGMKRQAATILALACRPQVMIFDETFDGLDPVMRSVIKRLVSEEVIDRGATAIITSHSLRELEDTCDQLALLHKGGIVLQSEVSDLKTSLFKVQIAFSREFSQEELAVEGAQLINVSIRGSVANLIINGDKDSICRKLADLGPVILEVLPLSLEEVFVYEMQSRGYSFENMFADEAKEVNK